MKKWIKGLTLDGDKEACVIVALMVLSAVPLVWLTVVMVLYMPAVFVVIAAISAAWFAIYKTLRWLSK